MTCTHVQLVLVFLAILFPARLGPFHGVIAPCLHDMAPLALCGASLVQDDLFGLAYPVDVAVQLGLHLGLTPQLQEIASTFDFLALLAELATEHAEHEIEHEERAENDERHEIDEVGSVAHGIVRLIHIK